MYACLVRNRNVLSELMCPNCHRLALRTRGGCYSVGFLGVFVTDPSELPFAWGRIGVVIVASGLGENQPCELSRSVHSSRQLQGIES
jgi:hypothetical protein